MNVVPYQIALKKTGLPTSLCSHPDYTSIEYLTAINNHLIVRMQNPLHPPSLFLYNQETNQFTAFADYHSFKSILPNITISTFSTCLQISQDNCILYQPHTDQPSPLIISIHGGPHNIFNTIFNTDISFYISKGYSVLVPNYPGSFGFGDSYLHSLCGHIGDIEIENIFNAVCYVLSCDHFHIDKNKVFLMGSSYGGFISTHLLEKYPDVFKVLVYCLFYYVESHYSKSCIGHSLHDDIFWYGLLDVCSLRNHSFSRRMGPKDSTNCGGKLYIFIGGCTTCLFIQSSPTASQGMANRVLHCLKWLVDFISCLLYLGRERLQGYQPANIWSLPLFKSIEKGCSVRNEWI